MPMSAQSDTVLLIDDDSRLRALVEEHLTEFGLKVVTLPDGRKMAETLKANQIDIVILDLGLPFEDGLSLCRKIRADNNVPILILTARGDEVDRVLGLEMGADDYLAKPFSPRELIARIKAILRRSRTPAAPARTEAPAVAFGPFSFDFQHQKLLRDGQIVALTSGEAKLLGILVQHAGQSLSRQQIMALSRGRSYGPYDRTIDVQISKLRKMIETDPADPRYIQTIWGEGYVFYTDMP
ncbi:response regulator [Acidiphilium sp.]|uniref:response regulator n=1 Tax=Acidiphilium sp. TaxID=527 RepID=UPI003D0610FB